MTQARAKPSIVLEKIMQQYRAKFPQKRNTLRHFEKQLANVLGRLDEKPLTFIVFSENYDDGVGDYKHAVDHYAWLQEVFADNPNVNIKMVALANKNKLPKLRLITDGKLKITYQRKGVIYSNPQVTDVVATHSDSDIVILDLPETQIAFTDTVQSDPYLAQLFKSADFILNIATHLNPDLTPIVNPKVCIHSRLEYQSGNISCKYSQLITEDAMGVGHQFTGIKAMDYRGPKKSNETDYFKAAGYLQFGEVLDDAIEFVVNLASEISTVELVIPCNQMTDAKAQEYAEEYGFGSVQVIRGKHTEFICVDGDNQRTLILRNFSGMSNQEVAEHLASSDVTFVSGDNSFGEWVSYGGIPLIRFPSWKEGFLDTVAYFAEGLGCEKLAEYLTKLNNGYTMQEVAVFTYMHYDELLAESNQFREEVMTNHNARHHFVYLLEVFLQKKVMEQKDSAANFIELYRLRDQLTGMKSDEMSVLAAKHGIMSYGKIAHYAARAVNPDLFEWAFQRGEVSDVRTKFGTGDCGYNRKQFADLLSNPLIEIDCTAMTPEQNRVLTLYIEQHADAAKVLKQGAKLCVIDNGKFVVFSLQQTLVNYQSESHLGEFRMLVCDDKANVLGQGWFGEVHAALGTLKYNNKHQLTFKSKEQKPRILKVVEHAQLGKAVIKREVAAMKRAQSVYHAKEPVFDDKHGYMISKQFPGMTLKEYLADYADFADEGDVYKIALNLLIALKELHQYGLIHRDIKPASIILDKDLEAHIIDLGSATDTPEYGNKGTPGCSSPEAFYNNNTVDQTSDWYSMGVVLCKLFFHDFNVDNPLAHQQWLRDHKCKVEGVNVKFLLQNLLAPEKSKRNLDAAIGQLKLIVGAQAKSSAQSKSSFVSMFFPAKPTPKHSIDAEGDLQPLDKRARAHALRAEVAARRKPKRGRDADEATKLAAPSPLKKHGH